LFRFHIVSGYPKTNRDTFPLGTSFEVLPFNLKATQSYWRELFKQELSLENSSEQGFIQAAVYDKQNELKSFGSIDQICHFRFIVKFKINFKDSSNWIYIKKMNFY
jgi:hypothetical protein